MPLPGWGTLFGAVFGKVMTYIPGRIEKIKNEKSRLEKERDEIKRINMDINNPADRAKASRLTAILTRIDDIDKILGVKATD
jgi:hypothetical protein